jgi:hypothetical protein
MTRVWLTSRLKYARSVPSEAESSVTSGGWPAGASPGRSRNHAIPRLTMMTAARTPSRR